MQCGRAPERPLATRSKTRRPLTREFITFPQVEILPKSLSSSGLASLVFVTRKRLASGCHTVLHTVSHFVWKTSIRWCAQWALSRSSPRRRRRLPPKPSTITTAARATSQPPASRQGKRNKRRTYGGKRLFLLIPPRVTADCFYSEASRSLFTRRKPFQHRAHPGSTYFSADLVAIVSVSRWPILGPEEELNWVIPSSLRPT